MKSFLMLFQAIVSVLLIVSILIQEKGVGLGMAFGGGGEFYKSKRGIDKVLFVVTVVLAVLFVGTSIAYIFVKGFASSQNYGGHLPPGLKKIKFL
ncbi:preprotein translocase subunit SecG [Candidatus Gracilibacteria bacterium]|nr:preprotein translocase subunit SecG [Candidatus Gracilibacteria bacterium]